MLGSLRLTVKDAMKELHALGKKFESRAAQRTLDPKEAVQILKDAIHTMLQNHNVPPDEALESQRFSSSTCKVALLAVRTTRVDSCEWLRTYSSRHSDIECSVLDALSASMALMTIFSPVPVGPEYAMEEFSGGGIGFNNPTRELLKEAQVVYGRDRQLSVILSIGSGRPKELSLEKVSTKPDGL
ncbi:hypothetical protein CPB86DRAFT_62753, partial [Serendipita vermifera]